MLNKCRVERNMLSWVTDAAFPFLQDQMKGWLGMNRQETQSSGPSHLMCLRKAHKQSSHFANHFLSYSVTFPGLGSCPVWLDTTDPKKGYQLSITSPSVSHFRDYPWKNLNPRQAASLCHPERFGCQSWCKQGIRPHINSSPSQR